ncbi:cell wall-binding protein [uncultured Clostridium sp.]|uniref:cell wall-binding protein n=1 Tax=uncultured Clostridium sp. TaxID=59620 RepID=UPI0025EFAF40|nr:cell wall-binding protein [uncultured Clostridium sp.]
MKRAQIFITAVLMAAICSISVPSYAWTSEGNGWISGTKGWSYMTNGIYADGWKNIDYSWYYFYKDTNFMAHDTIINGYYINSNGAWTEDMPYAVSQIMKNDLNYINSTLGKTAWHFYTEENVNFRNLCGDNWTVPDINGDVYWIQDEEVDIMGYFVSGNDVYCLGNQGGMDIYKVQCGNVVQSILYNYETSYRWR